MRYLYLCSAALWLLSCGGGGSGSSPAYTPSEKEQLRMEMTLVTPRWQAAADSVERWTAAAGGRLLRREKEAQRWHFYAIAIPVAQAKPFVEQVRTLGEVLSERTSLESVTQAYTDLEARLQSKEEAIARIRSLMERSTSPSDILKAERAMQELLSERDELRSRFEAMRQQVQTVQLDLTLRNPRYVDYSEGGSYFSQLLRSIEAGWEGFVYFTFAVAYLWWLWLLLAILIWWLRRQKKRIATAAPPKKDAGDPAAGPPAPTA